MKLGKFFLIALFSLVPNNGRDVNKATAEINFYFKEHKRIFILKAKKWVAG
jgi:hypothetical protein